MGPSRGGAQRDSGHGEQTQDVDVVALVGHRKSHEVEVGERPARLEREGRRGRAAHLVRVLGIGHEHALADNVGNRVEMAVDGLEAEVRHSDRISVGIDEGDGNPSAPVFTDGPLLGGEQGLGFLLQ